MNATATVKKHSGRWSEVVLTVIAHKRHSDVVNNVTLKQMTVFFVLIFVWVLFYTDGVNAITTWHKQKDMEALRPKMEVLANEGKDPAAMWLVQHYPSANAQRLPALVAKGYAEAMFYQGSIKLHVGDNDGIRLIEQSAAQGFLPAMQYIENHK